MFGDFTNFADVEAYSGIKSSMPTDALIAQLITRASAFMTRYLNRNLFSMSYNEWYSGSGNNSLTLKQLDITAVSVVTIDGFTLPASATPRDCGYVFDEGQLLYRFGIFCRGVKNVNVQYTAGLVTYSGSPPVATGIPPDLAQVCIDLVTVKYNRRTNLQIQGETLAQQTITYNNGDLTAGAKVALAQWQDKRPV